MKKLEAQELAPSKTEILIHYIEQILSYPEKVSARINLSVAKIEKQLVCVADIYAPNMNLEKHLNLEITSNHSLVLCRQFLTDLLNTDLLHENMQLSHYYSIKSMIENFTGIDAINNIGSRIRINLGESGKEFYEMMEMYNRVCEEMTEKKENNQRMK